MMTPSGFDSWRSFCRLACAREFFDLETKETVGIRRSSLEVIGNHLSSILLKPLDIVMKEFRNPLVIVALTVSMIFIASIIFYPAYTFGLACRILPFLKLVRPYHVKAALYVISQIVIGGMGLRTLGASLEPRINARHSKRSHRAGPDGGCSTTSLNMYPGEETSL